MILIAFNDHLHTSQKDVAIEKLAAQTGFRKGLKNHMLYSSLAIAPFAVGGNFLYKTIHTLCDFEGPIFNNQPKSVFLAAALPTLYFICCFLIRSGHTFLMKQSLIKDCFRRLYNKKVDYYGNILKIYDPNAHNCPYLLTDEQFIFFGRATGYSTKELIHCANKSGRMTVAQQLSYGNSIAQTV